MAAGAQGRESVHDPVVEAALRVFAAVGYDTTTAQMIAEAADVPREEIRDRGGKNGLYREIIERFFVQQSAMLDEVERDYTPDAADLVEFEDRYHLPIFARIDSILGPGFTGLPNFRVYLDVLVWSIFGFLVSGINGAHGRTLGPDTEEGRERFRTSMHRLREMALATS